MSLMILITETRCSFFFLVPRNRSYYLWIPETKTTPTRPVLDVSPVFWLCCWSLLYSCIYLLYSPHWLGSWIQLLSTSDWNRSSRKLPTQSCGLWYWPHAAIKVASLGCGGPCLGVGLRRPLSPSPASCCLRLCIRPIISPRPAGVSWVWVWLSSVVAAFPLLVVSFAQADFTQFGFYFSVWAGWIWTTDWFLTWHVSGASPAEDHWPHPALSVYLTRALASVLCS